MDLAAFLAGQDKIYDKFRNNTSARDGLDTDQAVAGRKGGYIIAIRHPDAVTEPLARFAKRVSRCVPALAYSSKQLHTTLDTEDVETDFVPDEHRLMELSDFVETLDHRRLSAVTLNYDTILHGNENVIAAGVPTNDGFLALMEYLMKRAEHCGITLRMPAITHITLNRFTRPVPADALKDFYALMKETPKVGNSTPTRVDVGHFNCTPRKFKLETYSSTCQTTF